MGKLALRVSYKGTDFKEIFTIARIYGRSILARRAIFANVLKSIS